MIIWLYQLSALCTQYLKIAFGRSFSDKLDDFLFRAVGICTADMPKNLVPGSCGGFRIGFGHGSAAPDSFRGLKDRYRHSVFLSPLVLSSVEIRDDKIGLHLEPGDDSGIVFLPALSESSHFFEVCGQNPVRLPNHISVFIDVHHEIHDHLFPPAGEAVLPAGVKIVALTPEISKIGEPFQTDKACFAAEELSVGDLAAGGDDLPPFPGILTAYTRPPIVW